MSVRNRERMLAPRSVAVGFRIERDGDSEAVEVRLPLQRARRTGREP